MKWLLMATILLQLTIVLLLVLGMKKGNKGGTSDGHDEKCT